MTQIIDELINIIIFMIWSLFSWFSETYIIDEMYAETTRKR